MGVAGDGRYKGGGTWGAGAQKVDDVRMGKHRGWGIHEGRRHTVGALGEGGGGRMGNGNLPHHIQLVQHLV